MAAGLAARELEVEAVLAEGGEGDLGEGARTRGKVDSDVGQQAEVSHLGGAELLAPSVLKGGHVVSKPSENACPSQVFKKSE